MSWFDTKNLASMASKALKEAQKKIDKVLEISDDIQEDENVGDFDDTIMPRTTPNESDCESKTMIEEHPFVPKDQLNDPKVADVDVLSPQQTPCSDKQDSVKLLSSIPSAMHLPDIETESIVIIGSSTEEPGVEVQGDHLGHNVNANNDKEATRFSGDDIPYELQTVDSDSTQSFEDVQLQSTQSGCESNIEVCQKTGKIFKSDSRSAHTSNDEMETATSSDIEIISNPNGDGSSTASNTTRTSPLKVENTSSTAIDTDKPTNTVSKGGHCREPSEISIISMDSPPSEDEIEKLLKRISELNSLVEARELRLLQSEQRNSELHERNNELLSLVSTENLQPSEEYTKRLSALEKKFQSCIRERDTLRGEVKELHAKIPKNNLTDALVESQSMVTELRQEGEKLSKEILQQSNIIKRLRSKEKTVDGQLKSMRDQFAATNEEIERLKKTLSAKEDVERTQIEAVHKMSSENQRLEKENGLLRSKLDDAQQKLNTLQCSFDAVKAELQQRSKQNSELSRTAFQTVEKEKMLIQGENHELQRQLKEFTDKLRSTELAAMKKEQQLREENRNLMDRLEAAELRAENSTQEISQTTIPLMRHLESLQQTLNQRTSKWNKDEKNLLEKLEASRARLKNLEHIEETANRRIDSLKSRCQESEEKLAHAIMQEEKTRITLQLDLNQRETEYKRKLSELTHQLEEFKLKIKILEDSQIVMQQCLDDAEHKLTGSVECLQMERDRSTNSLTELHHQSVSDAHRQSPTASAGINSLEDGGSIDWQHQDDDLDCISNPGRPVPGQGLSFHYISNNTTNNYEYLQSMMKQRDGELAQAQWELSRLQAERNVLQEELSRLSLEIENIKDKLQSYELMEVSYNELQTRYDALCQLYGEKVERCEELQLDLKECKEAYKIQIQELLMKT